MLPVPLAVLALVLLGQGVLLGYQAAALIGLVVLGAANFVVVPLLQTWLMAQVGQAAAGLVAAVNISVAGVAGALGAYFVDKGRTVVGYPLVGATAGLATSGVVMLALSFRF